MPVDVTRWLAVLGLLVAATALAALLLPGVRRAMAHVGSRLRRSWWRARVVWTWGGTCRDADLSTKRVKYRGLGDSRERIEIWIAPHLKRVQTTAHSVTITVKARRGQTLGELEAGAERLASAYGVQTFRCWPHPRKPQSVLLIEFVMRDLLTIDRCAEMPEPRVAVESIPVGLTQAGVRWWLKIRGWHTLVVGASGSGKGSILWNVACGLAPAVKADYVRLWGIDLKAGVELAVGAPLLHRHAYDAEAALETLRRLVDVIDERGERMAGVTRLHEPTAGDPMEVLLIDELASLTAYADAKTRAEANRLLSLILTKGRALGVVVIAFIQDPRKDVIAMRGLFTQTLALRLRTAEETVMVLGDGQSHKAPAHRINPSLPGTCWLVEESGATDRARADYWPDDRIRAVAKLYGSRSAEHEQPASWAA